MSLHSYQHFIRELRPHDHPFSSIIFAAMWKADPENSERLRLAFPNLYEEFMARYNSPGGAIESDGVLLSPDVNL